MVPRFDLARRGMLFVMEGLAGTTILFIDFANMWIRGGVAVLCYASAFRVIASAPRLRDRLGPAVGWRVWALGSTLAGALGCVGSALIGGAIGWLGVFFSLRFALVGAWALRQMTVASGANRP
jgi:hypothetical protein